MATQPKAPDRALLEVALYERLYRLLARRPELLTNEKADRADIAWTESPPGSMALIDRLMVEQVTELDRLCGYAVARLRTSAPASVLDLLGILTRERVLAMYYALPRERRRALLRDPVWGYHVQQVDPAEIASAFDFWADMPDGLLPDDMSHDAKRRYFRFVREAQRYRAGLPNDLSDDERRCVVGVGMPHDHKEHDV
jgi:hypothetical protein